jgi:nitroimidazol reductase NimA-like FMN-containing flavoprotein (pyridoxamine 5'-phosphate oxidase superfamily)
MKQVTRDIDPSSARDLIERVPRARLAFANSQGPQAQPVSFVWRDDRYLVGIRKDTRYLPSPGQEVALLIDEGIYYFELRAVYIRGLVQPVEAPLGAEDERTWFEIDASKTVAWDYGSMREVRDES